MAGHAPPKPYSLRHLRRTDPAEALAEADGAGEGNRTLV